MTEYLKPSFSVVVGGKAYADGWDRVFGKKHPPCPACKGSGEFRADTTYKCWVCEGSGAIDVDEPR